MKIDFKIPKLENTDKIGDAFKNHIILMWLIIAFSLLIYAGYIFYFKIFAIISPEPSPNIKMQTAQKNQLDQILEDLEARENARNAFKPENITNPFEIGQ